MTTMEIVTGIKTIRKLAESMAPTILQTNLHKHYNNSGEDLKGDLATKINKKLINKGIEPLTDLEEICACTYAQWIPNLNQYASSGRLKAILEEDLETSKQQRNKKPKKQEKQKKFPNQPAKGRKGKANMANNQKNTKSQSQSKNNKKDNKR